jgi:dienelactone hydrolase
MNEFVLVLLIAGVAALLTYLGAPAAERFDSSAITTQVSVRLLTLTALALLLSACRPIISPSATAEEGISPPPAMEYDLGDATIIQERFPEDSRFRNMPVRLNGVIAAPETGGPYPVVLILHGTHPGCPEDAGGVDRWPCDPALEQANYRGFSYLVRDLAAQGYVALAININADNTFGFGEPTPGERLGQIVDLHLNALALAAAGGANDFGVDLADRADVNNLALFGHSRGGEAAVALAREWADAPADAKRAYGPAAGLLLIAPAVVFVDPAEGVPTPMALINAACDGDVTDQNGRIFFEAARLAPEQKTWAAAVWLERANHNQFNTMLPRDPFGTPGRPDCDPLLAADAQRAFLTAYAGDFLTTIFSPDPAQVRAAMERMGSDVAAPAVDELYGKAAQVAWPAEVRHRLPLLTPTGEEAFTTSPVGGTVTSEGLTTFFCPEGSYTPFTAPELGVCRRSHVVVPGQPAHAVVSWEAPGGSLRFELPLGVDNLLIFDAVSVRTAVDPLSPLNAGGASQSFSVRLTDRQGNSAVVPVRADEPALRFPQGELGEPFFDIPLFTGRAPLLPVRIPLAAFEGVNLASIAEVALVFDQTDSGALFLADVELVRAPIGRQETLDAPPSRELIAAAEAGDVEAMRQLANLYAPTEAPGVQFGNLEQALLGIARAAWPGMPTLRSISTRSSATMPRWMTNKVTE